MSDTSPTGSPAGTPDEAYRLSATQQAALTDEIRRYADSIAANQVYAVEYDPNDTPEEMRRVDESVARNNANTLDVVRRYTDLAAVIERTGELGSAELQSVELREVVGAAGWDDSSQEVPAELREVADATLSAQRYDPELREVWSEADDYYARSSADEILGDEPDSSAVRSPDEAYRLSATQQAALTGELRAYAREIEGGTGDRVEYEANDTPEEMRQREESVARADDDLFKIAGRYAALADVIERTGELGPDALQSRELGDIVNIAGWDDPSTEAPAELSEIAEVARAALRAEAERSGSIPQVADPLEQYGRAQALTFGVDGATSDANNARASAAAWAIAAAAEGEEPFGARQVVDHGGDLAAAVSSPEFANVLQSELGPEDQGANAVETARAEILAHLQEHGAATAAQREPTSAAETLAPAAEVPLEQASPVEERSEQAEPGPRTVLDRIRAKLHLDSEARAERLSAVGITLRPQETSTAAVHERAQAQQPRAYGIEDTAR